MPIINAISNGSLRSFGVLINRQRPVNLSVVGSVEVLVVGGGGGGANPGNGGGGGAGGYTSSPSMGVTPATRYTVRIGAGGGSNSNGTNSGIFVTSAPGSALITWARGGGRGGGGNQPGIGGNSGPSTNPDGYGSGGGGGNRPLYGVPPAGPGNRTDGGASNLPQGQEGGRGGFTPTNTGPFGQGGEPQFGGGGGGGGGATQGGEWGGDTVTPYIYGGSWPFANNAPASITYQNAWGGNGGNGISSTISGSTFYYCGGGGGGGETPNNTNRRAVGGFGGGGGGNSPGSPVGRRQYANPNGVLTGNHPGSGDSYTGGGGGAGGGQGGSGVVIIRYPISFARANATFISGEPTYSEDATYRYYTFQGSGTIGFTPGTSVDP